MCGDQSSLFLSDRISCRLDWHKTSYVAVDGFELKLHLFNDFCGVCGG